MKSLYELMDEELRQLHEEGCIDPAKTDMFATLDKFISDDSTCADFIDALNNGVHIDMHSEVTVAKARARHSVITFLVGRVLFEFADFRRKIEWGLHLSKTQAAYLWRLTSVNHDIGYYSSNIRNGMVDYRKSYNPYLLDKHVAAQLGSHVAGTVMAYRQEEILNYDVYAREYHKGGKGEEKVDHGILGGIILYRSLYRKKNMPETEFFNLTSSITIAQHNIYKSANAKSDGMYIRHNLSRLLSTSDFRISTDTPFLLFLCLVDTIECIKKFSREKDSKAYLETRTVLNAILIGVTRDGITIDLTKLSKKASRNEELAKTYKQLLDSILDLQSWTVFRTEQSGNRIVITM